MALQPSQALIYGGKNTTASTSWEKGDSERRIHPVYEVISSLKELSSTGSGDPGKWWSDHPWKYLKDVSM